MNGVINVLKPPGMTSHDIVGYLRKTLGQKKIGHAGTLDPQAAGVLPVCLGQATRLVDYLGSGEKEYICRLTLGISTDTQDAWGAKVKETPVRNLSREDMEAVLPFFTGEIVQKTPMYSAVKVAGTPLYKMAREGKTIVARERKVSIYYLDLLDFHEQTAVLRVGCSRGTYIRTLCHDIGEYLGVGGHMSFLVRTKVGSFSLAESLTIEEIACLKTQAVLPVDRCLEGLHKITLEDGEVGLLKNGRRVRFTGEKRDGTVAILDKAGKLQALAEIITDVGEMTTWLKPKKVFNME